MEAVAIAAPLWRANLSANSLHWWCLYEPFGMKPILAIPHVASNQSGAYNSLTEVSAS